MAESKEEKKGLTIRMDQETRQQLDNIMKKCGFKSKDIAVQELINVFETHSERERLADSKGLLEEFDRYADSIQHLYYSAISAKHNAMDTAKLAVDRELKSKDAIIADLQERLADAEQKRKNADAEQKAMSENIQQYNSRINEYESKLADAQSIINSNDELIKTLQNAGRINEKKQ